jgi:hypothetical protein
LATLREHLLREGIVAELSRETLRRILRQGGESQLSYRQSQRDLVLANFVFAFFALFAAFAYLPSSRSELLSRYRPPPVPGR